MITIKLPYKSTDKFQSTLLERRKQYTSIVRYAYNRYCEGYTQKEILFDCNTKLNNVNKVNCFIKICGILEANQLWNRHNRKKNSKLIIFGGKLNFKQRCKNKITKEEYQSKRILSLNIQADKLKQGNRHFILDIIENNQLVFKLDRKHHYNLELPKLRQNIKKQLYKLQELNENKDTYYCYSIKLNEKYIYISFEEFKNDLAETNDLIETRYLGIDLNPTNIGISICEYQLNKNIKILLTKQYDFSSIINKIFNCKKSSDHKDTIYLNNKLDFETLQISKSISNLSKYWKCKYIFIEDLSFKSNKLKLSKEFSRLTKNIWKRNKFLKNLNKRCKINSQIINEINPAYSSFIGNLKYDFIDSINASIEIGRRGYEFKILRNKNNFYPTVKLKELIQHQWKEMGIDIRDESWKELFLKIKNSKFKYRVSLNECLHPFKVFSLSNKKSEVVLYDFN